MAMMKSFVPYPSIKIWLSIIVIVAPMLTLGESRDEMMKKIWQTPLGQMYQDYMTTASEEKAVAMAHEFTNKMFEQPELLFARVAALQILTEDLYARRRLNEEGLRRALIIQGHIWQREMTMRRHPGRNLAVQSVFAFVFSLFLGSPLVRKNMRNLFRAVFRFQREKLEIKKMFSRELFKDYDYSKGFQMFLAVFGPYTMIYFFWNDWKESARGEFEVDHQMLGGLEELVKTLSSF